MSIITGGLKSEPYLSLNPQGKMPLLLADGGFPIPESDSICRYLTEKYKSSGAPFILTNLKRQSLSDQICRIHDIYISPIQGCMYRAPGSKFAVFGTDRKAALIELKNQLQIIEKLIDSLDIKKQGNFLCGDEISLAGVFVPIIHIYPLSVL